MNENGTENGTFLKAASVAMNTQEGQAEVAASIPATENNQASAEIAVGQQSESTAPASQEASASAPVSEAVATEQNPPLISEPYNYWPDLERTTEGLVKDEESFGAILERAKSYDTILQEKEELQKTLVRPANDYIVKLNELALAGANPDQIKAFVKLNGYGDLKELSPIDLKVTRMVLTEGYSEDIARKIVTREFNLSQFDETIPEQKEEADILREQLRISAQTDLAKLNEYKKDLTIVNNPEKDAAEQAKLQEIAQISTYNSTVEREAPVIAKHFPEKLTYEFKVGDETVAYEDAIDKEFLERDLAVHVKEYFRDSLDPINSETVAQAYSFALGEYLKANDSHRLEKAYQKGHSQGYEIAVNKYENRSGLPRAQENQVIVTTESGLADFTKKMVGR